MGIATGENVLSNQRNQNCGGADKWCCHLLSDRLKSESCRCMRASLLWRYPTTALNVIVMQCRGLFSSDISNNIFLSHKKKLTLKYRIYFHEIWYEEGQQYHTSHIEGGKCLTCIALATLHKF